jgi:hypothetical protein
MLNLEQIFLAIAKKDNLCDSAAESISLKDVLNNGDLSRLVPIAISEIVREAAEPLLICNQLFTTINQKDGIYIQMPAVGAMNEIEEVAPGQEYGTEEITLGGGTDIRVSMRKFGIKLSLTEEMVEQSQWDVIGQWLKAAGKAFARKKNRVCFNLFNGQALTLVDNAAPTRSVLGRTLSGMGPGAGGNMERNGSFTAEDFFDIYAAMLAEGFAPSVIVVHPLTWAIWMKDPVLRVFAWQNGSGPMFNAYDLQGVKRDEFFNGLGMSKGGARPGETTPPDFKGSPVLPPYLNVPFRIMVSPQVPFNPVTKRTDMYFVDPENAGALIQGEPINHYQWTDPERDIQVVRLREKYCATMLNEGRGVGVVKNVPVTPNRVANFGATNVQMAQADVVYPESTDMTTAIP